MKGLIVIIILLISSFSYFGVVHNSSKSEVEGLNVQSITQKNEIVNEASNQNIIENIVLTKQENKSNDKEDKSVERNEKETKVESKTNSKNTTEKKEITQTESKPKTEDKKTVTKPTTEKNNNETKNKQETNKKEESNYTETKVEIAPKVECVGNKHMIESGNTGKWFNTKEEADSYYDAEIEKWGKQWENGEIETEEYLKNCPSGYEVWTCPQCQKWTLNFYYR